MTSCGMGLIKRAALVSVSVPVIVTVIVLAVAGAFTGCAAPNPPPAGAAPPAQPAPAPVAAPAAVPGGPSAHSIADFSAGLRCMDNLFLDHGVRDLSVLLEDRLAPAQGVDAGTRDMLAAAVSDMTQRSRAIRLVSSGKEWNTPAAAQPPRREPFAVAPQWALRGSMRRIDDFIAAGKPTASVLGLDLALLSTQDQSVVPGTASRNTVSVFSAGRAEIRKFGVAFNLPASAHDGQASALRALADLASIELFGRLARVPYWGCLGAAPGEPAVAAEIQDWYDVMAARPADLIGYFQAQLRLRRAYDGPLDGVVNPPLKDAVARTREALGLSREPRLSLDLFKAYLGAEPRQLEARLVPVAVPAAPATATASASTPLAVRIAADSEARRYAPGEAVQLTIQPNRDAHVYCFLQDEHRKITRFFPNRFQRDSRVQPAKGVQLPGAMRFEIRMNPRGVPETVLCFATERDVLAQLPAGVNAGDFDPLPVSGLEQLRGAFYKVAAGSFAQDSFQMRVR